MGIWVMVVTGFKSVMNQAEKYPCPEGVMKNRKRKKMNELQAERICERKQRGERKPEEK